MGLETSTPTDADLLTLMTGDLDLQPPNCSVTIQVDDPPDPILPDPVGLDTTGDTLILD